MAPTITREFALTKEETNSFLEDVLQLPEPNRKLEEDRLEFLNQIIMQMYFRIPFTNLRKDSNLIFKPPTFSEIIETMFSRKGGTCVNFTIFTFALLEALDYDIYICDGGHVGGKSNHSAIVVRNLTVPGSLHLVDTGAGVPLFRAVPLDFDTVSPTYHDDYMTYRFVKKTDGIIVCEKILAKDHYWDFAMSNKKKEHLIDKWYAFMTYEVDNPIDIDFLVETRKKLYENAPRYMLLTILLISFPKGRVHSITNKASFRSSEQGEITYSKLTGQDVITCTLKHYPQWSEDLLQEALSITEGMERKFWSQGKV